MGSEVGMVGVEGFIIVNIKRKDRILKDLVD